MEGQYLSLAQHPRGFDLMSQPPKHILCVYLLPFSLLLLSVKILLPAVYCFLWALDLLELALTCAINSVTCGSTTRSCRAIRNSLADHELQKYLQK
jgi:hypothetical protein